MICICDACHYIFNAELVSHSKYEIPKRCPDCGKMVVHTETGTTPAVRAATDAEIAEYERYQREILREIAERIYND